MQLLEKDVSVDEALSIFGIKEIPSTPELKSIYKKLALINHPDRGGDVESMALLNNAFEVLSRNEAGTKTKEYSYQANKAEQKSKEAKAKEQYEYMELMFNSTFDEESLIEYLQQFTSDQLECQVHIEPHRYSYYGANFTSDVEVYNPDRTLVYYVKYYIQSETLSSGGLTDNSMNVDPDDLAYNFSIVTDIYYNNRKQKLSQANYQWRKGKKVLFDYESIFPQIKLKKLFTSGGKKSFKKADFILGLQRGIPAQVHEQKGDYFIYPFADTDKTYFYINRSTFLGKALYSINGLWGLVNGKMKLQKFPYISIYETEENMLSLVNFFREVVRQINRLNLNPKENAEDIYDIASALYSEYVKQAE